MLSVFDVTGGGITKRDGLVGLTGSPIWIDLFGPNREEETEVEALLGIDIPTREELVEIEPSSRLYQEGDAWVMTATLMVQVDTQQPQKTTSTFILIGNTLVTVRYDTSKGVQMFLARAQKGHAGCHSAADVLVGLLESIIYRQADLIEHLQNDVDTISTDIFGDNNRRHGIRRQYSETLKKIGRAGVVASRAREALTSLGRLVTFLANVLTARGEPEALKVRVKTCARDVDSLADHVNFLASKITFLLDATLGMIGIAQNNVIKILSIAATVFLPPTLIGTIYGMNFKYMPELEWTSGYYLALGAMVLSGLLPYLYFQRRGWL